MFVGPDRVGVPGNSLTHPRRNSSRSSIKYTTELRHYSHEARSLSTCFEGSTPLQYCLPNPFR